MESGLRLVNYETLIIVLSVTLLRSGVSPFWNLLSLLARPENNTRALFEPTKEELETKKKEKERKERRAARRQAWLDEQAAKAQGSSESAEVPAAETSRAARRRLRDERREAQAAQAAQAAESSTSSSSSEDETPAEQDDAEGDDVMGNDSCLFAAVQMDQPVPSPNTDGAGSTSESEANPGPYVCLFCGEEFPSEAAEDYHVMRECANK